MTDLELLYLLEEAGYEPTFENLVILKENQKPEDGKDLGIKNIDVTGMVANKHSAALNNLKKNTDTNNTPNRSLRADRKSVNESFSDYELYQILENSGYETSEENLSILKEGLTSGEYYIDLEEGFHPIKAIKTYMSYGPRVKEAKEAYRSAKERRKSAAHMLKALPADQREGSKEEADLEAAANDEIDATIDSGAIKGERAATTKAVLRGDKK